MKATAPIAAHTLLCEYSGQVDFARHQIFNSLDDTMDLIRSPHSATRFLLQIASFTITSMSHDHSEQRYNFNHPYFNLFTCSLVICPSKRGNLARFLSGVNNFKGDQGKKKVHSLAIASIVAFLHLCSLSARS